MDYLAVVVTDRSRRQGHRDDLSGRRRIGGEPRRSTAAVHPATAAMAWTPGSSCRHLPAQVHHASVQPELCHLDFSTSSCHFRHTELLSRKSKGESEQLIESTSETYTAPGRKLCTFPD